MLLIVSQVSQPASEPGLQLASWTDGGATAFFFNAPPLHRRAMVYKKSFWPASNPLYIERHLFNSIHFSILTHSHTAQRNPARGLHHSHGSQWHGQLWLLRPDKWGGYATLLARSALQQHQGVRGIPVSAARRHRTGHGVCLRQGCVPDAAVHLQATGYSEWYVGSF